MSEQNPWRKTASKLIYENPWIRVREDQVIRPDGLPGIYGVVETKIAVGVVAISPELEVVLVGQFRYATNCYSWEIVEGGAERGEDPLAAIKRELQEEAGLVASNWKMLGGEIHLSNCISNEIALLYLAQDLSDTTQTPDGTEVLSLRREPLETCVRMVADGTIKDGMSIIGISRAAELAARGEISRR